VKWNIHIDTCKQYLSTYNKSRWFYQCRSM